MTDERNTGDCVCMGKGPAITRAIRNSGLGDAARHFRTARIELLKGIRAVLDSRIEHLSRAAGAKDAGTTVPVE